MAEESTSSSTERPLISMASCSRYPTLTPLAKKTCPSSGDSKPMTILSMVDLPAPLGPTSA